MKISAYAASDSSSPLKEFVYERIPTSNEIVVSIKYCSCSRGDIRFIENYWNDTVYPFVPGLEIIGTVEETGKDVKNHKKGDVVGIGYQIKSCFKCEYCLAGKEQFCLQQKVIPLNEYGGYADKIIVDYRYAFKMPINLQSATATPLLCSGLTVFAAINKCHVSAKMKVGVAGIGSLGHLAIQFLNKMGCEVTAFSHSPSKNRVLKDLGASQIESANDINSLQKQERQYDFILSTSSASLPWTSYIKMLKPDGTLCFVGLPLEEISFKTELLADYAQKSIIGNYIGSRKDMQHMLDFASQHNIQASTETFPIRKVNEGIKKMKQNEIPFCAVLTL